MRGGEVMSAKNAPIENLPKWAQSYIDDIERERDVAIRKLDDYLATAKPSSIYVEDLVCTGEEGRSPSFKRHYIQSNGVTFEHRGVLLRVLLRDEGIDCGYGLTNRESGSVCLTPRSYQQFYLMTKEDMRG